MILWFQKGQFCAEVITKNLLPIHKMRDIVLNYKTRDARKVFAFKKIANREI